MNTENNLDAQDQAIFDERVKARDAIDQPRIGDYIRFPTGELERFSHEWGDGMQTSPSGSFFLHASGRASLSCGGLNPTTPKEGLKRTSFVLPGQFWFFHHDRAGAGRGVYFTAPCRVYTTDEKYTGYLGSEFQSKAVIEAKKLLAKLEAACDDTRALIKDLESV